MIWEPPKGMDDYLDSTTYCDSQNQALRTVLSAIVKNTQSPKDAALRIFHFVRDEILFALDEHTPASETLRRKTGQCTTKTGLQIALLRAAAIPARFHLVDVHRNSLKGLISPSVFAQFEESITDHPWCECYLSGRWISCESIFDRALYESAVAQHLIDAKDIDTIDWDGDSDLIVLSRYILKDKGTHASLDEMMERERKDYAEFWPVMRASNQHTMKIRAGSDTG